MDIDTTVGGVSANAYLSLAEADAYWEGRPHGEVWTTTTADKSGLIIMATGLIDALLTPKRDLVRTPPSAGQVGYAYYLVRPTWLGLPTSTMQALAWPRVGVCTENGGALAPDVIPDGVKSATAELAGQLAKSDRLLDNAAVAQGISEIKAGSVAVSFSQHAQLLQVLPAIIFEWLAPWITCERIEPAGSLVFDAL